ncbi:MAG: hypothetical protein ACR2FY_24225 [Pirellulaceae bacterium]
MVKSCERLPKWFVEVDEEGYVRRSDEGTLGCVLQLRTEIAQGERFALKIPRLLADTVKENAYICELTKDEADNVRIAHINGRAGLLSSQVIATNLVAFRRETKQSTAEDPTAKAQHDHVIFIQFDKRFRPRLCCANYDKDDNLSVFPEKVRKDVASFLTKENWKALRNESKDKSGNEFAEPVFVTGGSSQGRVGRLASEMKLDRVERTWFAGLPSIAFEWAQGTLQQALGIKALENWPLESFLTLFDRIMVGVATLHPVLFTVPERDK